jgi:NADPH:quinone reductase
MSAREDDRTVNANGSQKAAHARAAGADLTVNYRTGDVAAALREFSDGKGLAHAADLDFGVNVAMLVAQMAANGSIAYYAPRGNVKPVFPADDFMRRNLALFGMVLNGAPLELRRRAQNDIVRWLEEGKRDGGMKHTVSAVYPPGDLISAKARRSRSMACRTCRPACPRSSPRRRAA